MTSRSQALMAATLPLVMPTASPASGASRLFEIGRYSKSPNRSRRSFRMPSWTKWSPVFASYFGKMCAIFMKSSARRSADGESFERAAKAPDETLSSEPLGEPQQWPARPGTPKGSIDRSSDVLPPARHGEAFQPPVEVGLPALVDQDSRDVTQVEAAPGKRLAAFEQAEHLEDDHVSKALLAPAAVGVGTGAKAHVEGVEHCPEPRQKLDLFPPAKVRSVVQHAHMLGREEWVRQRVRAPFVERRVVIRRGDQERLVARLQKEAHARQAAAVPYRAPRSLAQPGRAEIGSDRDEVLSPALHDGLEPAPVP